MKRIIVASLLFLVGCGSVSTFDGGKSLRPGRVSFGVGTEALALLNESAPFTADLRVGLPAGFQVGAKFEGISAGIEGKWQILGTPAGEPPPGERSFTGNRVWVPAGEETDASPDVLDRDWEKGLVLVEETVTRPDWSREPTALAFFAGAGLGGLPVAHSYVGLVVSRESERWEPYAAIRYARIKILEVESTGQADFFADAWNAVADEDIGFWLGTVGGRWKWSDRVALVPEIGWMVFPDGDNDLGQVGVELEFRF